MGLTYIKKITPPSAECAASAPALLLLLHGTGADEHNLLPLIDLVVPPNVVVASLRATTDPALLESFTNSTALKEVNEWCTRAVTPATASTTLELLALLLQLAALLLDFLVYVVLFRCGSAALEAARGSERICLLDGLRVQRLGLTHHLMRCV